MFDSARLDIIALIENNLLLFSDHPHQMSILFHDIDVEGHRPIKQHAYRVKPSNLALPIVKLTWMMYSRIPPHGPST